MVKFIQIILLSFSLLVGLESVSAQNTLTDSLSFGLSFRNLSPAFISGRISDFAVNPANTSEYYVAVASGNIWKTSNNGTTFSPVFENYGSYSIGCLAMDPNNSNVVWAGTGENNHQRSVSYGDGVYKTVNGGKSWKNMGLNESMHIGMIAIDPRDSDVVFVAAEGSVWGPGGDRGLYKTVDGGETWEKIFEISEHTGVNNVVLSPDNPDIMYITTEQRRRRTQIKIEGGPESNVYKSTDGGKNFRKLSCGIPNVDKGGSGIAVSPVNPNVVYLMIEAALDQGGFFRSTDRGESFEKMSGYNTCGQYYGEICCDPKDVDIVYALETRSKYTEDGGKTWKNVSTHHRHVDDHAMWIDPANTDHYMIGGDGGVYETFDRGKHFIHKTGIPVTQFYRVNVDNTEPFYFVYGGTQDNSSMGGPSGSLYTDGISRAEWVITLGGDGFWQAIDPDDPNIVYSEYQYGNVYRHDKQSGENTNIKPRERLGEETYKWNWNAPLIISAHKGTRLYMAANKVFKSEDRGNSWEVISDDISSGIPRDFWPVMDRFWPAEAVDKNGSTSLYGTAVTIAESPVNEKVLFVGTDDGVLSITEDMGVTWRNISKFSNVPEYTYISDIKPSRFDEKTIYITFDNRKHNDLKPYILKSEDLGFSWKLISGDLPAKGAVYSIEQDFVKPELLFAGTEYGVFYSPDEGNHWVPLKSGIPTISVRDIAIQERETDLVLATFGRGFYILDNYAPLRELDRSFLEKDHHFFEVKDALQYTIRSRGGYGFGSMPVNSDNREYGAVFTYYLKEVPKTITESRREEEKELFKKKERIPLPTVADLREEDKEVGPYLSFTISDNEGNVVRKLHRRAKKGFNRESWNLRHASKYPKRSVRDKYDPLNVEPDAMPVAPGKYYVKLELITNDTVMVIGEPQPFNVKRLDNVTLPAGDNETLIAFQKKVDELARVIRGGERLTDELTQKVLHIKQTVHASPQAGDALKIAIDMALEELDDIKWRFRGEIPRASPEERTPAQVTINDRLGSLQAVHSRSTSEVTATQQMVYSVLETELPPLLDRLEKVAYKSIPEIEVMLDAIDAPWTPGRMPKWQKD
jgi:photosystem II stability/assembly factor-like uncharacterized protein